MYKELLTCFDSEAELSTTSYACPGETCEDLGFNTDQCPEGFTPYEIDGDSKCYNDEHIAVYGAYNEQRLTGLHETQSIDQFSYGVSDRGASIRIPIITVEKGYKGWLEDRRPASNADPYKIAARIIKTVKSA